MPFCPCCQRESREFAPFGVTRRPRARCPKCGSLERHRLLWLFLTSRPHLLEGTQRLLHIAPEPVMAGLFKSVPGIHYISADLMAATDIRLDITALPFADGSLDAVVCSHVLDHVPDDRAAMCEFRRVLDPHGWAILQSPMDPRRAIAVEDFSVQAPAERERVFGQFDHVRGRDYFDRLTTAGFRVEAVPFADHLGPKTAARHAVRREEIVLCRPQQAA